MKPNTKYTKSGRINIAYQVFGTGPVDLVYIPGWVSNIDLMWSCPELVHFLTELGVYCRILLFDKRGTGLSDRIVELSTLEERMDDIRAVMDAVGSEKAVLFGHSEGGSVSALFAATYPNRTIALITFGVFAKRRYAPYYPWAPTDEERQKVYDMIEESWGGGDMNLDTLAPSKAHDPRFMEWLANYFRSGASPSAALVLTKMNTEVDIIDILGSIKVPTLLMQRNRDIDVKIEEGRFIEKRIPGARLVEFEGNDHLFWAGNTQEVLDEMIAFITNIKSNKEHAKQLLTISCMKVLSEDLRVPLDHEKLHFCEMLIRRYVKQYRGNIVEIDSGKFLSLFEGPSKAVHCSIDLQDVVQVMSIKLGIAIHIGECYFDQSDNIRGPVRETVFDIIRNISAGQIIITQTVKNLLSGAGLNFADAGKLIQGNSTEKLPLLIVKDRLRSDSAENSLPWISRNDSFLENVLQCIEQQLSNEFYGVENLCRDVGVSERQLQRKLKSISNKSPNQMIRSVRLHRAKELIALKKLNISEAAFQTGFSNLSYFSKCFKDEFGFLPSTLNH